MNVHTIVIAAAVTALSATTVAIAAPNTVVVNSTKGTCVVAKAGTAKGPTTVTVGGAQVASAFLDMTGCVAPVAIVRKAGVFQMPFRSQGFACTPGITGRTGTWKCIFRAADTATMITLSFSYRY